MFKWGGKIKSTEVKRKATLNEKSIDGERLSNCIFCGKSFYFKGSNDIAPVCSECKNKKKKTQGGYTDVRIERQTD